MKWKHLLPLVLVILAGFTQLTVLAMFEAGRRQGLWVVASSVIIATIAMYGMPRLTVSKAWLFSICILALAIAAFAALLVAEKMDRPEITVFFRSSSFKITALTILITSGWLVGLVAFCGSLLLPVKKPQ